MTDNYSYDSLLQMAPWKAKREEILRRDQQRCRNCGSKTGLQVHHRQYHINPATGLKREPWHYSNKYLVTLCDKCHKTGHQHYTIPVFKH